MMSFIRQRFNLWCLVSGTRGTGEGALNNQSAFLRWLCEVRFHICSTGFGGDDSPARESAVLLQVILPTRSALRLIPDNRPVIGGFQSV